LDYNVEDWNRAMATFAQFLYHRKEKYATYPAKTGPGTVNEPVPFLSEEDEQGILIGEGRAPEDIDGQTHYSAVARLKMEGTGHN
jgi:hypothetical protein